jgi:nucleotide-binding universal stress UspA family protein
MRCTCLVVAHDGTDRGDQLLRALLSRDVLAGRVHVVHVLPRVEPSLATAHMSDHEYLEAFHRLSHALHDGPWSKATIHVLRGDPADQIAHVARDAAADLVAVGSHGRRGLARLALGSVAEQVVHRAPCPVLILPDALVADDGLAVPRAPADGVDA